MLSVRPCMCNCNSIYFRLDLNHNKEHLHNQNNERKRRTIILHNLITRVTKLTCPNMIYNGLTDEITIIIYSSH